MTKKNDLLHCIKVNENPFIRSPEKFGIMSYTVGGVAA